MRSRAVAVAVALAGAVIGLFGTGPASAVQPGRAEEPLVRVGTEGTYPPFTYVDPRTGQLTGYDVEVMRAVADKAGWRVRFVQSTFDSIFPALDARRIDVVANQVTINRSGRRATCSRRRTRTRVGSSSPRPTTTPSRL